MTDPPNRPDAIREVPVWRVGPGGARHTVVTESLVELALGPRILMRASVLPKSLDDFAVGFLAGEGLIDGAAAVHEILVAPDSSRVEVRADVDPDRIALFRERLATSSGCGGGVSAAADALPRVESDTRFEPADVSDRMRELTEAGHLFRKTGGVHAAAVTDGQMLLAVAEDIGRHNAVDKVIGRCLRQGVDLARTAVLSTGRASADILAKAARTGIPVVVSRGAVTSRAVDLAAASGITLVGFARTGRMNVYAAPWRLGLAPREGDTR